jgi:hypothetical protein
MAIPRSFTFEYVAEFSKEGFSDSEIVLHGADSSGENEVRLVGLNPMIRFWNGRLVLVASGKDKSSVRNTSFPIGDAVNLAARPGDQLYLILTGSAGIGLSLLRQQRLILAIGAVAEVPLGRDIQAIRGSEGYNFFENPAADRWLEFNVQGEHLMLREREVSEIGDYYIFVERCWQGGLGGTDECVSLCISDNLTMKIAAMRSAILLAHGDLKQVRWDVSEHFFKL